MPNSDNYGTMKVCPECGRKYFIGDIGAWVYKKNRTKKNGVTITYYFCRWNCMRKWEREHMPQRKREEDWYY